MKLARVRASEDLWRQMEQILLSRYPKFEWASFFEFGWHSRGSDLLLTIARLHEPNKNDLNITVGHVEISETYSLRTALLAEKSLLGIGVIHSHPQDFLVEPSLIDDDMDGYYNDYFSAFAPNRPYASLIIAKNREGALSLSGRVQFLGEWWQVESFATVGKTIRRIYTTKAVLRPTPKPLKARLARLSTQLGERATDLLWNSEVTIAGCGGTGSPAAHLLARSGVGTLNIVDYQRIDDSNAERMHGCEEAHLKAEPRPFKVETLRELIHRINPEIRVRAIRGNILQPYAKSLAISSDLILNCTDQNHSRAFLSELAYKYLVPTLQVNVAIERTKDGVGGEPIHFTRYRPGLPCAWCQEPAAQFAWKVAAELMSPAECERRKQEAKAAIARGERADPYWLGEAPVVPTVGSLTTAAASIAANYAVGILTDTYSPPSEFLELDLLAPDLGVVSVPLKSNPSCGCSNLVGFADQGDFRATISAPEHWESELLL
jgi:hypothetical protein